MRRKTKIALELKTLVSNSGEPSEDFPENYHLKLQGNSICGVDIKQMEPRAKRPRCRHRIAWTLHWSR